MSSRDLAKVIMVQGASSHAGKSIMATALCRIFAQEGLQVAPFKAQNMSLNSFATPDGGEIGRSQAVQAAAAMTSPRVEMNPLLLKPEGENRSQVVLMGKPNTVASARAYYRMKPFIWDAVTVALDRLRAEYDVIMIEGAGSPADSKPETGRHRQHEGGPSRWRIRPVGRRHRQWRRLCAAGRNHGTAGSE